eukprot:jgi/Mesen1/6407/ME000329S05568
MVEIRKRKRKGKVENSSDNVVTAADGGPGEESSKGMLHRLVEWTSLPEYLKDNEYIVGHYRADLPLKQTLLSMFTIHNETGNIWTHLIGFVLFLVLTIYSVRAIPTVVEIPRAHMSDMLKNLPAHLPSLPKLPSLPSLPVEFPELRRLASSLQAAWPQFHIPESLAACMSVEAHKHHAENSFLQNFCEDVVDLVRPLFMSSKGPVTRWPFFLFMGGAMFCLLCSSLCHLLSCQSAALNKTLWRLDYVGIATLIATSFYPPVFYSFMCDPWPRNTYLAAITLLGVATVSVSFFSVFQTRAYRKVRAGLFVAMGLSGLIPTAHKMLVGYQQRIVLITTAYELAMGACYGLGAVFYATRIPERWLPGKFDIAGHSHQIFHVLVVMGAYTHYQAGLLYLQWRDVQGCAIA